MNNISCFKIRKSILRGMKKSNNGNFQLFDVAEALTDSVNLKQYIKRMCSRDEVCH